MNDAKSVCGAMAQRELGAFLVAVTELFGAEQARISAADWLDAFELAPPPERTRRDWRAVTIAAAARLAYRTTAPSAATSHRIPAGLWHVS